MTPQQLAIGAGLAGIAWLTYKAAPAELAGQVDQAAADAYDGAAEVVDAWTAGALHLSAMASVSSAQLANANVRAMLAVIRRGEGTADPLGYFRLFGGDLVDSLEIHPHLKVTRGGYTSTAAGAYQALSSTWDEAAQIMGLPDFSPASQDLFAVGRIASRGALADVRNGNFTAAVTKLGREWASLPGSPYGQPTISLATARAVYADAGGSTVDA